MGLLMNEAVMGAAGAGIRRFNALAQETPDCVLLTLGEPEFGTPEPIKEQAIRSLEDGETHYPPNNGMPYLLEALSRDAAARGLSYRPDEIVVTCGATEALFSAMFAMLNPGDEVIIPTPAFGLYKGITEMCRGVCVSVDTSGSAFQLTEQSLERAISKKTKALILTSPNNPTGCVYNEETMDLVARAARRTGIYVICDEVYRQLSYVDGLVSFAARYPDLREQLVVVDSFSKPYAMTGWRLGWLMADEAVKAQIQKVHQYVAVSVTSFTQRACVTALQCDTAPMREAYRRRRDLVYGRLRAMGMDVTCPEGAFYIFPSIQQYGMGSEEFCTRLIREAGVGLVPGVCFGTEGYVRLSYCCSEAQLNKGLDRLERFIKGL